MLKSPNNLHHAYLLVSDRGTGEKFLHDFWQEMGVTLAGSPDFFLYKEALFGIDEARDLSIQAGRKAFTGQKVFFITPEKITLEAQNALLKTFEDPIPDTHFFLVLPDIALVLPTLLSRMQVVRVQHSVLDKEVKRFLGLSPAERLKFVKKFIDNEENLSKFMDELLLLTRERNVFNMRKFSDDRGVSPRLILEHLALVL